MSKKPETPKKARGPDRDTDWYEPFLSVLRNTANVRASCVAAKVSRASAYRAKEVDEEFAARWAEAMEDAVDALEAVARTRASNSSDTLLIFLLKAHRPKKYNVETVKIEHSGPDGGPIPILETPEELKKLPADELVRRYREALGNPGPTK